MRERYEKSIQTFLIMRAKNKDELGDIDWNCDFFVAGYLDSLAIYSLLSHLENEFQTRLPLAKLIENFPSTFNELYEYVVKGSKNLT